MSREQRRRWLLRAHAAAARFVRREDAKNYFLSNRDAFVAGWLLGYRAHRRDAEADRRFGQPHFGHDEIPNLGIVPALVPAGSISIAEAHAPASGQIAQQNFCPKCGGCVHPNCWHQASGRNRCEC